MTNNLIAIRDGLIYVLGVIILVVILGAAMSSLVLFLQELRYLNKEVRSTSGAERKRWIRQRRRLWLSLLPFVKY